MRTAGLLTRAFRNLGPGLLPFADAATAELPMGRLLRLALFQVTVANNSPFKATIAWDDARRNATTAGAAPGGLTGTAPAVDSYVMSRSSTHRTSGLEGIRPAP